MAEPEHIVSALQAFWSVSEELPLRGKQVLVTAGPTHEAIDPVRFIGNHSSGKMGFAIAEKLAQKGARVTLISGPTHCKTSQIGIEIQRVTSANEMYEAAKTAFATADIAIFAAAVADYTPQNVSDKKIKKKDDDMFIELKKTIDIASELGKIKREGQICIGFALETDNEQANALSKIQRKNLDFIVLNSLNDAGAGFQHDTNKISILNKAGEIKHFPLKHKNEVAEDIVALVL
jgi:phosphopantothenoylcysteine decarboxylase/phosphopantothenate--cysteine ligase